MPLKKCISTLEATYPVYVNQKVFTFPININLLIYKGNNFLRRNRIVPGDVLYSLGDMKDSTHTHIITHFHTHSHARRSLRFV